jgi:SAM-dependent methyltransferase
VSLGNVNWLANDEVVEPVGRNIVRQLARRSVPLVCLYYIVDDWLHGRRLARGNIGNDLGARSDLDAEAVVCYGTSVWKEYRAKAGGTDFTGRIAEIGPGGVEVAAWHLLANGASEVHLVDRFDASPDAARAAQIRAAAMHDPAIAELFANSPGDPPGLFRHIGDAAEDFFTQAAGTFDAILSCAVLEHVTDPIAALTSMARALRPGGVMIHAVDLRDHNMFKGLPSLTHLTVAESVWPAMTANSGRPNRISLSRYREWLDGSRLDGSLIVNMLAGCRGGVELASANDAPEPLRRTAFAEVAKVRPKLIRRLRDDSDADLATAGFTLVARRPQVPPLGGACG